jgi:hypothetical protein
MVWDFLSTLTNHSGYGTLVKENIENQTAFYFKVPAKFQLEEYTWE